MPPRSLWDRLPEELRARILEHAAASTIQLRWRRLARWGHARKPIWSVVRAHLDGLGAWRALAPYALVRREWRAEPRSWLGVDAPMAATILVEARDLGLWGHAAAASP
jgi:hypothetical protein